MATKTVKSLYIK